MLIIVSGGQTGVDRAALDAAIATALPYRGWCPKGGWAEDSPEPPGVRVRYPKLRETPQSSPHQRTEWNVRDADALMVLTGAGGLGPSPGGFGPSQGTALAVASAEAGEKPHIVIDIDEPDALRKAKEFLSAQGRCALCIAGPRENEVPGIYAKALALLVAVFKS
jgi:hypothetical protein